MIGFLETYLPKTIWLALQTDPQLENDEIQEIRLRTHKQIFVKSKNHRIFLEHPNLTTQEMTEVVAKISQYSLYAFTEQLGQGFITLSGGHRVGFCGKAVFVNGQVESLRQISSINIRIARQAKGCAEEWIPYLFDGDTLCHTLLVSPPACGKTTFLRDMIRILSDDAKGYTIGVVDERGEIAGMEDGIPQLDIGQCTDVQENCPKAEGMTFLLRSMSPDIIAVDELGCGEDYRSAVSMSHAGVIVMATIHGNSFSDLQQQETSRKLLSSMRCGRVVILSNGHGVGTVEEIRDAQGGYVYKREEIKK